MASSCLLILAACVCFGSAHPFFFANSPFFAGQGLRLNAKNMAANISSGVNDHISSVFNSINRKNAGLQALQSSHSSMSSSSSSLPNGVVSSFSSSSSSSSKNGEPPKVSSSFNSFHGLFG